MNREIKFRAWDGEQMIILENSGLQCFDFEGSFSLGFTVDGYSGFWAHEQYERASKESNKFPITQSLGIKDRDGQEYFFDDIVQFPNDSIGVLVWFGDCLGISSGEIGNYHATDQVRSIELTDCLIIGNIHENPELLK